jgi:hypothetical protein
MMKDDNALEFLLSVAKLINILGSEVMKAMIKLYEVGCFWFLLSSSGTSRLIKG